jgi:hypothetical protein
MYGAVEQTQAKATRFTPIVSISLVQNLARAAAQSYKTKIQTRGITILYIRYAAAAR